MDQLVAGRTLGINHLPAIGIAFFRRPRSYAALRCSAPERARPYRSRLTASAPGRPPAGRRSRARSVHRPVETSSDRAFHSSQRDVAMPSRGRRAAPTGRLRPGSRRLHPPMTPTRFSSKAPWAAPLSSRFSLLRPSAESLTPSAGRLRSSLPSSPVIPCTAVTKFSLESDREPGLPSLETRAGLLHRYLHCRRVIECTVSPFDRDLKGAGQEVTGGDPQ